MGVAISDSPAGPFRDIGQPLDGIAGIDPKIFIDDDGQAYIYCNDHQVAKLKDNMIEIAESPRDIVYASAEVMDDEMIQFEEGSFMHKRGNKYYFSYSNWQSETTTAYYAIGDSPYGPFEWQGALAGETRGSPDHHSIIEFRGQHYYFYHMDTDWLDKSELNWYGHRRLTCFDKMYYNDDGSIQLIQRTYGDPNFIGINAGGAAYKGNDGFLYHSDQYYSMSQTKSSTSPIAGTANDILYQTERFASWFSYEIDVLDGEYLVTLYFSENYHDASKKRVFSVAIEGETIIRDLDIFSEVGKNAAIEKLQSVPVSDGSLTIEFSASIDNALVNAIRVERVDVKEDLCSQNPCDIGFNCTDQGDGVYECLHNNVCDSSPCQTYEKCVDNGNSTYSCHYNDPCLDSTCESNETCIDFGNSTHYCEKIKPCIEDPCGSFETCIDFGNNTYACKYIDSCDSVPCQGFETCIDLGNSTHVCHYDGPCLDDPCDDSDICHDLGEGIYECIQTSACGSNSCEDYEVCIDVGNHTHSCQYNNPCDNNPCLTLEGGHKCIDKGEGSFECESPPTSSPSGEPSIQYTDAFKDITSDEDTSDDQMSQDDVTEVSSENNDSSVNDEESSEVSLGLLIGASLGGLAILLFTVALTYFCVKGRKIEPTIPLFS